MFQSINKCHFDTASLSACIANSSLPFFLCRILRCLRNHIHVNLIISFLIRSLAYFATYFYAMLMISDPVHFVSYSTFAWYFQVNSFFICRKYKTLLGFALHQVLFHIDKSNGFSPYVLTAPKIGYWSALFIWIYWNCCWFLL